MFIYFPFESLFGIGKHKQSQHQLQFGATWWWEMLIILFPSQCIKGRSKQRCIQRQAQDARADHGGRRCSQMTAASTAIFRPLHQKSIRSYLDSIKNSFLSIAFHRPKPQSRLFPPSASKDISRQITIDNKHSPIRWHVVAVCVERVICSRHCCRRQRKNILLRCQCRGCSSVEWWVVCWTSSSKELGETQRAETKARTIKPNEKRKRMILHRGGVGWRAQCASINFDGVEEGRNSWDKNLQISDFDLKLWKNFS